MIHRKETLNPRALSTTVALLMGTTAMTALSLTTLPAPALAQDNSGSQVLEEIQVTGTRIRRTTDFDTANPTTVVDDSYLHNLGIVNLGDAMIDIPSNVSTFTPQATGNSNFFAGSTIANLRGINPYFGSRTLTLIDGRRHVPTNQGDSVDMNFIPSIILQRMDVVTGGASAAYGSGAISGVNNVILNHTLEGFKVDFDYGLTGHGDGDNYHGAAAWGTQLFEGRSHLVLAGEYQKQESVQCQDNRSWCTAGRGYLSNASFFATRYQQYDQLDPSLPQYVRRNNLHYNAISNTGVLWKGGAFFGWGYYDPFFQTPPPASTYSITPDGTGVVPFAVGLNAAGQPSSSVNTSAVGGDGLPTTQFNNLIGQTERYTFNGHFDYDITDSIKLAIDGEYGKVKTLNDNTRAWTSTAIPLMPDNPYLTTAITDAMAELGADVLSKDWTAQLNPYSTFDTEVYSFAADLSGKFGESSWTWDAYVTHGHTKRTQYVNDNIHLDASNFALDATTDGEGNPVCRVSLDPTGYIDTYLPGASPAVKEYLAGVAQGCVPLNPLGTAALDQTAKDYAFGYLQEDEIVNQTVAAANVSGDLFEGFGAGPVGLAVGGEYRWENIKNLNKSEAPATDYYIQYGDSFRGKVNVWEVYGEVNVPILKEVPLANRLELDAAVRYSHYKNVGQGPIFDSATHELTTWKISGFWDPTTWLRIRGSQSRDSRAGNFRELYYGQTLHSGGSFGYADFPFNTDPADIVLQGNPNVEPEKSDTSTIGVVLTPAGKLDGLQFAADYYRIKLKDGITPAGGQLSDLIAACRAAAMQPCMDTLGTIYWDQPSVDANPSDSSAWTVERAIEQSYNARSYQVKGIDFTLNYNRMFDNGDSMNIRAIATKTISQQVQTTIGAPPRDIVGQTGTANGFLPDFQSSPNWVANVSFTYNTGGFSGTIQGRYIAEGTYDFYGIEEGDPNYAPNIGATFDSNTIPFYQNYTLNLTYTFDEFMGSNSNMQVFLNVNNLFDVSPPFGGSAVYYDQLGRRFRLGARLQF